VLTMNDRFGTEGIIQNGALYVSEKHIVEVGSYKELKALYPTATVIGSPRYWVMPGFVNAHQHGKGMTSFQLGGLDEPLEVGRVKTQPLDKVPPYLDTLYAALRMIEAGVTTCLHYNSSRGPREYESDVRERLRAYQEAGIRVSFGLDIRNRNHVVYGDEEFIATLPPALQERARQRIMQPRTANAEDYVRLVGELSNELGSNPEDRVKIFLTPAGPQWCTEELLQVIRRLSDERRLGYPDPRFGNQISTRLLFTKVWKECSRMARRPRLFGAAGQSGPWRVAK